MVLTREDLLKKGWSEEEIDYTFNVIDKSKDKKSAFIHFLDGAIAWFGLLIVFVGSLILSVVLMPFIITVQGFFLYFMSFFIAIILGVVFNFLLIQINELGQEIIYGDVLLPVLGIINVYVMKGISDLLIVTMHLSYSPPNFLIFGVLYVSGLAGPFFVVHRKQILEKYSKYFSKKKIDSNQNDDASEENTASPSLEDYYQIYLEREREKERRKQLYQKRLKEQLLKRLNKV